MQKAEETKSANTPQWKHPAYIYKSVLALFALVTILGVFVIALDDSKSPKNNNVIEVDQNYINFSDEAKSSVCESLPAEKIGQAIGNEIGDTQRLLPDTEIDGGIIAGCKYVTMLKNGQKLQSVSIVTQTFKDEAKAIELFNAQTSKGKPIESIAGNASYVSGTNPQLVLRNGTKITIITGVTASQDVKDVQTELVAIGKL